MSHFAKIENGLVTQVIVAEQDFIDTQEGQWVQTSYNTRGAIHYGQDGQPDMGVPLRGNYAGIGYIYDSVNDVFYAPQPFPSWTLENNWTWKPPVEMPTDGKLYKWDESTLSWKIPKEISGFI
jgi:hypothetical protein